MSDDDSKPPTDPPVVQDEKGSEDTSDAVPDTVSVTSADESTANSQKEASSDVDGTCCPETPCNGTEVLRDGEIRCLSKRDMGNNNKDDCGCANIEHKNLLKFACKEQEAMEKKLVELKREHDAFLKNKKKYDKIKQTFSKTIKNYETLCKQALEQLETDLKTSGGVVARLHWIRFFAKTIEEQMEAETRLRKGYYQAWVKDVEAMSSCGWDELMDAASMALEAAETVLRNRKDCPDKWSSVMKLLVKWDINKHGPEEVKGMLDEVFGEFKDRKNDELRQSSIKRIEVKTVLMAAPNIDSI